MKGIIFLTAILLVTSSLASPSSGSHACACPRMYQPICAEGRTFPNRCMLDCESRRLRKALQVQCVGECQYC